MFSGSFVFVQIMEHLPWLIFQQCVTRYDGDKHVKAFTCLINTDAWRSLNSLIGRVCGKSKRACARKPPSFIKLVFEAECGATLPVDMRDIEGG